MTHDEFCAPHSTPHVHYTREIWGGRRQHGWRLVTWLCSGASQTWGPGPCITNIYMYVSLQKNQITSCSESMFEVLFTDMRCFRCYDVMWMSLTYVENLNWRFRFRIRGVNGVLKKQIVLKQALVAEQQWSHVTNPVLEVWSEIPLPGTLLTAWLERGPKVCG